jgi:hypothetical protein
MVLRQEVLKTSVTDHSDCAEMYGNNTQAEVPEAGLASITTYYIVIMPVFVYQIL